MNDRMTLWTAIAILPFAIALKLIALHGALISTRPTAGTRLRARCRARSS
jgi:hypothetical protein